MGEVGVEVVVSFREVLQLLGWQDHRARGEMAFRGLDRLQSLSSSVCIGAFIDHWV